MAMDNNNHTDNTMDKELDLRLTQSEAADLHSALNRIFVEAPDVDEAWKQISCQIKAPSATHHHIPMETVVKALISMAAVVIVAFLLFRNFSSSAPSGDPTLAAVESPSTQGAPSPALPSADNAGNNPSQASSATSANEEMETAETGRGKSKELVLSDGTRVWLNAESRLLYPKKFAKDERRVRLDGEAYFEVKHKKKKPFIVETSQLIATDLGTAFNVKAYSGKPTQLVLVEGKVAVNKKGDTQQIMMNPDEMVTLSNDQLTKTAVDAYPMIQWKNGLFYFHKTALIDVMKELGKWYGINIVFENKSNMQTSVHFVASRSETIDEIVRQLNSIEGVDVVKDNHEITVK